MGIRVLGALHAKQIFRQSLARNRSDVPRGHFAVYVGENQRRFVVPISFLDNPSFQKLLEKAEEEFGLDHRMDCLTLPCKEDVFMALASQLVNCRS